VSQSVIDQQRDATEESEMGENEDADLVSQVGWCPSGTCEEIEGGIESVWLGVIRGDVRLSGLSGACEGVSSEAHDPTKEQPRGGFEGRVGERGSQSIDEWME